MSSIANKLAMCRDIKVIDYIVIGGIIGLVFLIIARSIIKIRKGESGGCSCGCSGCSMDCDCKH